MHLFKKLIDCIIIDNPLKDIQLQAKQTENIFGVSLNILQPRVTSNMPLIIPFPKEFMLNTDKILFIKNAQPLNNPISVKISVNKKQIVIYAPTKNILSIVLEIVVPSKLSGSVKLLEFTAGVL